MSNTPFWYPEIMLTAEQVAQAMHEDEQFGFQVLANLADIENSASRIAEGDCGSIHHQGVEPWLALLARRIEENE